MTPEVPPVLALREVVAGYVGDVDVLNGVELDVAEGEIVTVVGPNGAGKSTLMKAVCGLVRPRRGRVLLRGQDLAGRKPHQIARLGVGYVPQLDNVFPRLSIEENVALGAMPFRDVDAGRRWTALCELFPVLEKRRTQAAGTLSGGERQMVAMARALMPEPAVLLLDEPSAGLAPGFVDVVFDTIEQVNRAGVTILLVEQNARRALGVSDRGYVLDLGSNRFQGRGSDLLDDPQVAELYIGGAAPSRAVE